MHSAPIRVAFCALLFAVLAAAPSPADEAAEAGRGILAQHKGAVMTVRFVMSIAAGGGNYEYSREVNGTVIDPTGLTVVSLSETDPTALNEDQARERGVTVQVTDLRLLLEDGTEVESEVVLRDKDLDLAFVRPSEKYREPMVCVDLTQDAAVGLLDQVIALSRLGKVAGREYAVSIERVESIITKPRVFYVPGKDPTMTALGSPIFTLNGEFAGIVAMRAIKATGGDMGERSMAVIVTAQDIAESAEQVPEFTEKKETEPDAETEEAEALRHTDEPGSEAQEPASAEAGSETN
ncbi:MAG TPA: hypothetical protein HPP77_07860 [Candidatus Hydrogenedentes bacterium]|nr:hypothetical protein [Candidatus Hydrogenedentota bacterium]HIJ72519.1 hypothetical protein [Candidatus Hydrogenedentota bacterium]